MEGQIGNLSSSKSNRFKQFFIDHWKIFAGVLIALILAACFALMIYRIVIYHQELEAIKLIEEFEAQQHQDFTNVAYAEFAHRTNITNETLEAENRMVRVVEQHAIEVSDRLSEFNYELFFNETLILEIEGFIREDSLPIDKVEKLNTLVSIMAAVQATTKICPMNENDQEKCNLGLDEISDILKDPSAKPEQKKHVWLEYHTVVGHKLKQMYKEYVTLKNEEASAHGYENTAESWNSDMDLDNFREAYENLYQTLHPLYLQLHAYVRRKLKEKYGDLLSERGPIPTHLLGDLWAQSWTAIMNFTMPYPNEPEMDLTREMVNQGYTVEKMVQMAEDYFVSMNLSRMTQKFYEKSMFLKPTDREVVCNAASFDFLTQDDFRMSMCARISLQDWVTIHHEMGHIEYFMQYKVQPKIKHRNGANAGFHEAIGDFISASVQSVKHLKKVGLLDVKVKQETIINQLYKVGLYQVAFLPFSYLADVWRWDVFEGKIQSKSYNCHWWKLKEKYQGVEPPADRNNDDFDPVSKYHIAANVPYIRYFVSMVLQYQFLRSLCKVAGEFRDNDPNMLLSECDLHGHKNAGNLLKKMLAMGSSKPWPDALEVVTNQREMDVSGILQYFKPLHDWLVADNKKNKAYVGWEHSKVKIECGR